MKQARASPPCKALRLWWEFLWPPQNPRYQKYPGSIFLKLSNTERRKVPGFLTRVHLCLFMPSVLFLEFILRRNYSPLLEEIPLIGCYSVFFTGSGAGSCGWIVYAAPRALAHSRHHKTGFCWLFVPQRFAPVALRGISSQPLAAFK